MFFVSGAQRTGALGRNRIFFESGQKNYARARLGKKKKKRTNAHVSTHRNVSVRVSVSALPAASIKSDVPVDQSPMHSVM